VETVSCTTQMDDWGAVSPHNIDHVFVSD
jgi:hypothetical protein